MPQIKFYKLKKKNSLDRINKPKALDFVLKCLNFDGGFGCVPGAESHAGQVKLFFCCSGIYYYNLMLKLIIFRLDLLLFRVFVDYERT